MTLLESVPITLRIFHSMWFYWTLFDSNSSCFALFDSFFLGLTWIVCVGLCVWLKNLLDSFCFILLNFVSIWLDLLNFVRLSLTHAVMHKFCACLQTTCLFLPIFVVHSTNVDDKLKTLIYCRQFITFHVSSWFILTFCKTK